MMELSGEARFPLRGQFGAVVFVDAGNVWPADLHFRLGALRADAGPGIRWTTPVGVVRADIGFQLTPIAGLLVNGVPETRRWRIHFSIGHAF
jgi:outer membrane translocation and assembly module TamA